MVADQMAKLVAGMQRQTGEKHPLGQQTLTNRSRGYQGVNPQADQGQGPAGRGSSSAAAWTAPPIRPGWIPAAGGADERPHPAEPPPGGCRTSSPRRWSLRSRRAPAPSSDRPGCRWHGSLCRSLPPPHRGARSGRPRASAMAARAGLMSISSTRAPGTRAASHAVRQPTTPAPMTAMRPPTGGRASHRMLTAVSMLAASAARSVGTASGIGATASAGTTNRSWCGCRQKTRRPVK